MRLKLKIACLPFGFGVVQYFHEILLEILVVAQCVVDGDDGVFLRFPPSSKCTEDVPNCYDFGRVLSKSGLQRLVKFTVREVLRLMDICL